MGWQAYRGGVVLFGFVLTVAIQVSHAIGNEPIDEAEVRRKIEALALRDETLPYDEQAFNWLSRRRNQVVPQLIAALDDANPKVAEECLRLLHEAPRSQELTDALIGKASNDKSPLQYAALRQLERSAADPRVARLLDAASLAANRFPDPLVRARWAWLAGQKVRATEILEPLLDAGDDQRYETVKAIRLMGEIGDPGSVGLLEPLAAGDYWELAIEAHKALATIAPNGHGLTKDQATFLDNLWGFKETEEHFRQRIRRLGELSIGEIRPFVMQMLRDKGYNAPYLALLLLTKWKDKEALPQIHELMQTARFSRRAAVEAYLAIDGTQQAEKDVLALLSGSDDFVQEAVLRGIVAADIPANRKTAILRAARDKASSPSAVAHALRYRREHGFEISIQLMSEETNLPALSCYCELAILDEEKRLSSQVRRAMDLLCAESTVSAGADHIDNHIASAGCVILQAVAAYDLKDCAPDVRKLMRSSNAALRTAAQAAGARLGIQEAMTDLFAQLNADDKYVRKLAADALKSIPIKNEAERAAREDAVLRCLGKPSEDYALRVLASCGREKTVKALESILDDSDPRRAVHAAWVLAQLSDKAAATKGLRRVAVFGMFHHNVYQQGAGIDFRIAPDLNFHQVTMRLNPEPEKRASAEAPVSIPGDLLKPFAMDNTEQQYAVRCYRRMEVAGEAYINDVAFLQCGGLADGDSPTSFGQSHLPLLKEIAAHDSHLKRVMVKGQAVAHFEYRQMAAKAIAAITGEKARYVGLAGETLDSDAFPEPYTDQNQLLAKFIVDRVASARLPDKPQSDVEWRSAEFYRIPVLELERQFGAEVLDSIAVEAKRRGVDMTRILPTKAP